MSDLHEAPLLHLIKYRFYNSKIYTWTSDILISINPYYWIDGLYDLPIISNEIKSGELSIKKNPHVYTVAERVYCNLMYYKKDQSLIVSGESGAGKTEACKRVMSLIAKISSGKQILIR